MAMKFSVEDIEVNINIDGDDDDVPSDITPEVVEESTIAVDDAEQDMDDKEENLDDIEKNITDMMEVIDSFDLVIDNINTFGKVTKEMLHIMNKNNALGAALGIHLPRFESDDLPDDVDVSSIDTRMVLEAAEEQKEGMFKKVGTAIANFFKMIYEFFKSLVDWKTRAKKKIQILKSMEMVPEEEFEKKKRRLPKKISITTRMSNLEKMIVPFGEITGYMDAISKGQSLSDSNAVQKCIDSVQKCKELLEFTGWRVEAIKDTKMGRAMASIKRGATPTFFMKEAKTYKDAGITATDARGFVTKFADLLSAFDSKGKVALFASRGIRKANPALDKESVKSDVATLKELSKLQKIIIAETKFMYGLVVRIMSDASKTATPSK